MFVKNVLKEVIRFGECKTKEKVYESIDSVKTLFKTDLLMNETLDMVINNYESINDIFIEEIIKSNIETVNNNSQIVKDTLQNKSYINIIQSNYNNPFLIMFSSAVFLSNNEVIDLYKLLSNIDTKIILQNGIIVCEDKKNYTLCKLQLLNLIYESNNDMVFNDISQLINSILYYDVDLVDKSFVSVVYITNNYNPNEMKFILEDIEEINKVFVYLESEKIQQNKDYKLDIIRYLTPEIIYETDLNYILFECENKKCKLFQPKYYVPSLVENNFITKGLHTSNTNWLLDTNEQKKQTRLDIRGLKMFDMDCSYYNKLVNLLIEFDEKEEYSKRNFENIHYSKKMKQYKASDILDIISSPITKTSYNNSGPYPLIDSTDKSHGIYKFIDKYTDEGTEDKPLITVGTRRDGTGCVFVHTYPFSHTSKIKVLKLKDNVKLNVYNIAYSLLEALSTCDNITISTIKELMLEVIA